MDTGFLADIIKEVLVSDGLACLPGFGTFRTEFVPACFSDKGFTVNPPYLKLVFDAGVKDDTALVDFYAANNNIAPSRAFDVIAGKVSAVRQELIASRAVLLPGLGYLRVTHDGSYFFVAEENLEIFPSYDMLEPVSLRYLPVIMSAGAHADAAVSTDIPVLTEPAVTQDASVSTDTALAPDAGAQAEAGTSGNAAAFGNNGATGDNLVMTDSVDRTDSEAGDAACISKKTPRLHPAVTAVLVLVLLSVLALAALAVLGRSCPELVDPLLYNAEELRILYTVL